MLVKRARAKKAVYIARVRFQRTHIVVGRTITESATDYAPSESVQQKESPSRQVPELIPLQEKDLQSLKRERCKFKYKLVS